MRIVRSLIVMFIVLLPCISAHATRVTITFDGFGPDGSANYPYYIGNAYKVYGGVDVTFGATAYGNPETNYFDLANAGVNLFQYQQGWHVYQQDSNYPSVSGTNTALNYGTGGPIIFGSPVSDVGAFFNVYANDLTFSAYDSSNTLIGSVILPATIQPTPGGPIYYELSYDNIFSVTLTGLPDFHNLDDFQFTTSYDTAAFPDQFLPEPVIPKPVPEPTTIVLLGAGIGGLAVWRKRKRGELFPWCRLVGKFNSNKSDG